MKKYVWLMYSVIAGWLFLAQSMEAQSKFQDVMQQRGLSEQDAIAALKVYQPSGKHDEYYVFAQRRTIGSSVGLRCSFDADIEIYQRFYARTVARIRF